MKQNGSGTKLSGWLNMKFERILYIEFKFSSSIKKAVAPRTPEDRIETKASRYPGKYLIGNGNAVWS